MAHGLKGHWETQVVNVPITAVGGSCVVGTASVIVVARVTVVAVTIASSAADILAYFAQIAYYCVTNH